MLKTYLVLATVILVLACAHTQQSTPPPQTPASNACKHEPKVFRCVQYVDNYDGDTLTVNIPDVHPLIGTKMSVRIAGVDTAEIKGKAPCEKQMATKARDFVATKLKQAKKIELANIDRDKYFRIVADVMVDGQSITTLLLQNKLAYGYDGGTKARPDWCKPLSH